MKKGYFKTALLYGVLLLSSSVEAEFHCSSSVSYRFQVKDSDEVEVPWVGLKAAGIDEAEAKSKLMEQLGAEKRKAFDRCEREHANVASCVSSRITRLASGNHQISFEARRKLEETISEDCQRAQGRCTSVKASEIVCTEIKKEEAPVEGEEAAGKEKDKKGADKGKKK